MSETAITREHIFSIADAIQAEGIWPTSGKIIDRLEVDYPYSIVLSYLVEWQRDPQRLAVHEMPPPPESISQGMSQVWTQAWLLNQEQIGKERQQFELALHHIDSEKQEMLKEILKLEGQSPDFIGLQNRHEQDREKSDTQFLALDKKLSVIEIEKQSWEREKLRLLAESNHLKAELDSQQEMVVENYSGQREVQDKIRHSNNEKVILSDQVTELEYQISLLQAKDSAQERKIQWFTEQLDDQSAVDGGAKLQASISALNEQLDEKEKLLRSNEKNSTDKEAEIDQLQQELKKERITQEETEASYVELQEKLQNNSLEFREYQQFNNDENRQFKELIDVMEKDLQTYKTTETKNLQEIQQKDNDLNDLISNLQNLEKDNSDLKDQMATSSLETIQNKLNETEVENKALNDKNVLLLGEGEKLELQVARYKEAYDKATVQRKEAMSLMSKLKADYATLEHSLEEQRIKTEKTHKRIETLEVKIASFKHKKNEITVSSSIAEVSEMEQISEIPLLSEIEALSTEKDTVIEKESVSNIASLIDEDDQKVESTLVDEADFELPDMVDETDSESTSRIAKL